MIVKLQLQVCRDVFWEPRIKIEMTFVDDNKQTTIELINFDKELKRIKIN